MTTQSLPLQVLVSGAGSEAAAATRRGVQGAGDLAGVPGRRSSQLHQPGLPQLRAHQPEPQRPRKIQLRGRSGGPALSRWGGGHTCMHGCFQPAQILAPFPSSISRYGKSRKEGAERMSVFVLGPNEAANSMNGGFTRGRAWSHGDPPPPLRSMHGSSSDQARVCGLTCSLPHLSVCCRSTSSS